MTLSSEQTRLSLSVMEKELAWREAARTLNFGPPDPELAKHHFLEFVRWGHPTYKVGWFHRELAAALEWFSREVGASRSPRLLIAAPPRSGKSEQVSRRLPNFHLGRHPDHEIIVASYGQDFVNDLSRDARRVRDEAIELWPHLAPGSRDGVENWTTQGGGRYFAVGAGGACTGRGCHMLVLDDLVKNADEARSQVVRTARWEWYQSTAYTRLAPGGGVLAMATRWSTDDPSGRMLEQLARGEENWRVVSYPAIAIEDEPFRKRGEALHPERYDIETLKHIRTVLGSRQFSALYQQNPTPDSGAVFDRGWLDERYAHDPQRPVNPYDEILCSIDATLSDAATSDYVSMVVVGRKGSTFDVLDEVHDRMTYVGLRSAARDLAAKWKPTVILIERAASGHALIDELAREFPMVVGFKPSEFGAKDTRALMVTPLFEAKNVRFPAGAPFVSAFVEELAAFPSGAHDDRVDSLVQALIYFTRKMANGASTKAVIGNMNAALRAINRR